MDEKSEEYREGERLMKLAEAIVENLEDELSETRLAALLVRDHGASEERAIVAARWTFIGFEMGEKLRVARSSPDELRQEADELERYIEERKKQ